MASDEKLTDYLLEVFVIIDHLNENWFVDDARTDKIQDIFHEDYCLTSLILFPTSDECIFGVPKHQFQEVGVIDECREADIVFASVPLDQVLKFVKGSRFRLYCCLKD